MLASPGDVNIFKLLSNQDTVDITTANINRSVEFEVEEDKDDGLNVHEFLSSIKNTHVCKHDVRSRDACEECNVDRHDDDNRRHDDDDETRYDENDNMHQEKRSNTHFSDAIASKTTPRLDSKDSHQSDDYPQMHPQVHSTPLRRSPSFENIDPVEERRKQAALRRLFEKSKITKLTREFSMSDSLEVMLDELDAIGTEEAIEGYVSFMGVCLTVVTSLLEVGNRRIGSPMSLDGLSSSITYDMKKYDAVFRRMTSKYFKHGESNPIVSLLFLLVGSIITQHVSNSFFPSMPQSMPPQSMPSQSMPPQSMPQSNSVPKPTQPPQQSNPMMSMIGSLFENPDTIANLGKMMNNPSSNPLMSMFGSILTPNSSVPPPTNGTPIPIKTPRARMPPPVKRRVYIPSSRAIRLEEEEEEEEEDLTHKMSNLKL